MTSLQEDVEGETDADPDDGEADENPQRGEGGPILEVVRLAAAPPEGAASVQGVHEVQAVLQGV